MNRLWTILLAGSLCLSGCLDLGVRVKIEKDFSGILAFRFEMLDQMYQLAKAQGQQAGVDMSMFDEETLRKQLKEQGGRLDSFTNEVENGIRKIALEMWVPDVEQALQTGGGFVTLEKTDSIWVLHFLKDSLSENLFKGDPEMVTQQLAAVMPLMSGLKINLEIEVPQLVETNLEKVGKKVARYSLDFDTEIASKPNDEAVAALKQILTPKSVTFQGVSR